MLSPNRSGLVRQGALLALAACALPLSLLAQVRRPEPTPSGGARRGSATVPKRRTELFIGLGTTKLNAANATTASMPILSLGFRKQYAPEWLHLSGALDLGTTKVDGQYFPYEKRSLGDSLQFVAVDGTATMIAGRVGVDAMKAIDEDNKYRVGLSAQVGAYAMLPSPAGGADAGMFVAPTLSLSLVGQTDITRTLGVTGSIGLAQFLNFDRDKLRPSDPSLEDPAFVTPFFPPPAGVKNVSGPRVSIGMTYRLGVKRVAKGGAR